MTKLSSDLTLEELRDRIKAAGVSIPEARLEMVRTLLANALAPVRAIDSEALKTLEPAVTFDAEGLPPGGDHGER
ncbi:MAG: hypothetical protein ACRELA_07330 [Candidatus Rokuibacteriota bacterium]